MIEKQPLTPPQLVSLLEIAVGQAKEAVLITSSQLDPPGPEILFVNPAFCEMTGYREEEVLHRTPRILQGPKSDPSMLKRLRETLERHEPFSGETVNYRKDGGEYYVEWDITPVRAGASEITHFLSIQRNVTQRKLADIQLQDLFRQVEKSRNDLGSILDALRIGTVMSDEHERVVFLNAAARQLFDWRDPTAPETSWPDLFDLDRGNTNELRALIGKPAAQRSRIPLQFDRSNGRRIWLEVDVKDDPRDPRGKIFFLYDVTEVTICAGGSTSGRNFTIFSARARRCSRCISRFATWRASMRRFSSKARPAPAKSWSPGRFTRRVTARASRSSPSTAPVLPNP